MSSLVTLPTEVLLVIMDHLSAQQDRLNLARCNVRMYTELYPQAFIHMELDPCCCAQRVEKLVDFLLHNPSMAGEVKSLKLGKMWTCGQHHTALVTTWSFDGIFKQSVKKFGQSSTSSLKQWLYNIPTDDKPIAWQALVICLLPNITYLECVWPDRSTSFTDCMLRKAYQHLVPFNPTPTPAFQSLREVVFKFPSDIVRETPRIETWSKSWDISRLNPFFQTSSMHTIKGYGLNGVCVHLLPLEPSTITHVELHQSHSVCGIREFIVSCLNLKSFKYFCSEDSGSHPVATGYCLESFMNLISSKAHSLNTLCLDYTPLPPDYNMSADGCIRFNKFHVLKHLQLPMHTFSEINVSHLILAKHLPPSLERLSVTQWCVEAPNGNIINQLVNLVRLKHMFPSLVTIEIYGTFIQHLFATGGEEERLREIPSGDIPRPAIYEAHKRLSDACKEMGVDLSVQDVRLV
ncbi:hypothetical protein DTO002I6_2922 [Penicillium roqueforti]|nr:hypothetical protein DTO002I6_2922 [Penicillium roqueforti]